MKLSEFIKKIPSQSKEIIYFGGSFNPWHEGHAECLRKAPKDAIKIVIPDHNPLKDLNKREFNIDISKITELNNNIYIYDQFFKNNKKNPTIEWLKIINKELPNISHSLLMGYDSYLNLEKWKDYKEVLINLDSIYVLNRENLSTESLYDIKVNFLGPHNFEHLSSSQIRNI